MKPMRPRGFTLIELMIAVAVVAILSAIALPSYRSYVLKSRRVDAKNAVLEMASRQERFYGIQNKYTETPKDLGYPSLPVDVNSTGSSYYALSVTLTNAGFTAKATPTGSQTADTACYGFQVDQAGVQSNVDAGNNRFTDPNCW